MAKKQKRQAKKLLAELESVSMFKTVNGTHACIGTIGTHSIHREGNNFKVAAILVRRAFTAYLNHQQ